MKYNGKGFVNGIPARDLTEEEVKKFGKKFLIDSGIYTEDKSEKKVEEDKHNDSSRN